MNYPNLGKYSKIEKAIRRVGEDKLKSYLLLKDHRIDKFDRNMNMIRYTLQHGPTAASKVFHVSEAFPSVILYKYGQYAEEILKEIERKGQ